MFPFLNLSLPSLDSNCFTLGFLSRAGLDAEWLPSVQISLWQRFLDLLKSQKHDKDVSDMIQQFSDTVAPQNFVEDLDFNAVGYEAKTYVDMSVLSTCIKYGSNTTEIDPVRDQLCFSASNAYNRASLQLTVTMSHSSTYKSLWAAVTNFAKKAVDVKLIKQRGEDAVRLFDQIKATTSVSDQVELLNTLMIEGHDLDKLHKSLIANSFTDEAQILQDGISDLSEHIRALSFEDLKCVIDALWKTEGESEECFDAIGESLVPPSQISELEYCQIAGFVFLACRLRNTMSCMSHTHSRTSSV